MSETDLKKLPYRPIVYLDKINKVPYVLMRNFFITSDLTPEEFVEEKKLPSEALGIILKDKWMTLRESFKQEHAGDYKTLIAVVADGALRIEMEIQTLKMSQVQDQVNFLKEYMQKWGDLYGRYPDGKLMIDVMGQPFMLHVPSSSGEVSSRKGQSELILTYMKVLESIDNVHQRLTGRIIEVETDGPIKKAGFMHLLESKKPDE